MENTNKIELASLLKGIFSSAAFTPVIDNGYCHSNGNQSTV